MRSEEAKYSLSRSLFECDMVEIIKAGIVGAGWAGNKAADAYSKVEGAEAGLIFDVSEEAAKGLARAHGCEWTTNFDELLERSDIQVVEICTPPFLHATQAVKAAGAGKHICVQKPMARNVRECREIIEAAEKNKVKLILQFQYRFNDITVRARKLIDKGEIGKPLFSHFRGAISPNVAAGKQGGWIMDPEKSGGQLVEYNIHFYDLLRWYHGEVKSVYSETSRLVPIFKGKNPPYDHSIVTLRFKDDTLGVVAGTWSGSRDTPWNLGEVFGSKGVLHFRDTQNSFLSLQRDDKPEMSWASPRDGFSERVAYFVECIREDKPVARSTGVDGLRAVEVGVAAVESSEKHAPIGLPLRGQ